MLSGVTIMLMKFRDEVISKARRDSTNWGLMSQAVTALHKYWERTTSSDSWDRSFSSLLKTVWEQVLPIPEDYKHWVHDLAKVPWKSWESLQDYIKVFLSRVDSQQITSAVAIQDQLLLNLAPATLDFTGESSYSVFLANHQELDAALNSEGYIQEAFLRHVNVVGMGFLTRPRPVSVPITSGRAKTSTNASQVNGPPGYPGPVSWSEAG